MKKDMKFETNIMCNGCLSRVQPHLDKESTIKEWKVDLESQEKVLTVVSEHLNESEIVEKIESLGFEIKPLG